MISNFVVLALDFVLLILLLVYRFCTIDIIIFDPHLIVVPWIHVESGFWMMIGLGYLLHTSYVEVAKCALTTLIKRWDMDTTTFHLLPGEITMILEDVYHITRVPITEYLLYTTLTSSSSAQKGLSKWLT